MQFHLIWKGVWMKQLNIFYIPIAEVAFDGLTKSLLPSSFIEFRLMICIDTGWQCLRKSVNNEVPLYLPVAHGERILSSLWISLLGRVSTSGRISISSRISSPIFNLCLIVRQYLMVKPSQIVMLFPIVRLYPLVKAVSYCQVPQLVICIRILLNE